MVSSLALGVVLLLATACDGFALPSKCTATGDMCGTSNSSAPKCCDADQCRPPPDCGGPPPPTSPVYTCHAPPPPPPPGCRAEGQSCKRDDDCCEDECHDMYCMDGVCRMLMPPTSLPTARPGFRHLEPWEQPAQRLSVNNATEYLIATIDNACLQIPAMMKTKAIFCHGPYPRADFNEVQKEWVAGRGSCKEQGACPSPAFII